MLCGFCLTEVMSTSAVVHGVFGEAVVPTGSRRVFPRDPRSLFLVCFCGQFARLMDWGSTSLICWRLCCKLPRLMSLRNVCRCFHWQVTSNACFSASSLLAGDCAFLMGFGLVEL